MLHVTNGDCTARTLRELRPGEPVLPWRDVLHEGPVPSGLSLEQTSDLRARFLAECGWGAYDTIRRDMAERGRMLLEADAVTLWFEHDLYDQLQLIQVLDALSSSGTQVALICPAAYLGPMTVAELSALWPQRQLVTTEQKRLASRAWDAFRAPKPEALHKFLQQDTSVLPHLRSAFERHLEEFPSGPDGLSRTERQILCAAAQRPANFHDLYRATQAMEDPVYMGDSIVELHARRLANGQTPLLTVDSFALTAAGERVLRGEVDNRSWNKLDRWLGGVHLTNFE